MTITELRSLNVSEQHAAPKSHDVTHRGGAPSDSLGRRHRASRTSREVDARDSSARVADLRGDDRMGRQIDEPTLQVLYLERRRPGVTCPAIDFRPRGLIRSDDYSRLGRGN